MQKRRRVKQPLSLQERLAAFAEEARAKAAALKPGIERDDMLRRVGQAETALQWVNSPGLQSPE